MTSVVRDCMENTSVTVKCTKLVITFSSVLLLIMNFVITFSNVDPRGDSRVDPQTTSVCPLIDNEK